MPSDEQPQATTGQNSTDSPESSQTEKAQEELRTQLANEAGLTRLSRMIGMDSLNRNLEAEDEAVAENIRRCESEMFDGSAGNSTGDRSEGEPVKIMAAGNVTINQPPPAIQQTSQPQATASTPAAGLGTKAMLAAVLGSAGLTGALATGVPWLLGAFDKPAAVAAADTDTDTYTQVEAVQGYQPGDPKPEMPK